MSRRHEPSSKRPKQPKPSTISLENPSQEATTYHPSPPGPVIATQMQTCPPGPTLQQTSAMDYQRTHFSTQPANYAEAHFRESPNYHPHANFNPSYRDSSVTYPWQTGTETKNIQRQSLAEEVSPHLLGSVEQRSMFRSMVHPL